MNKTGNAMSLQNLHVGWLQSAAFADLKLQPVQRGHLLEVGGVQIEHCKGALFCWNQVVLFLLGY